MLRALLCLPVLSLINPAHAGEDFILEGFVMPSRNINCTVQKESLEETGASDGWRLYCVRFKPKTVVVILNKQGVETFDGDGDQPSGEGKWVFTYGQPWESGPFKCFSSQTGLTCTHKNGKGFKLSRKEIRTF